MQRIRYTGDGWGEKQTKHGKVTQIIISNQGRRLSEKDAMIIVQKQGCLVERGPQRSLIETEAAEENCSGSLPLTKSFCYPEGNFLQYLEQSSGKAGIDLKANM